MEEDEYYFHVRVGHYYDGGWHVLNSYFEGLGGIDRTGYSADRERQGRRLIFFTAAPENNNHLYKRKGEGLTWPRKK